MMNFTLVGSSESCPTIRRDPFPRVSGGVCIKVMGLNQQEFPGEVHEKRAPGCLWKKKGMTSYQVIWGLFQKP